MNARESIKTLVEALQKEESPSFALGYLESFFAGVIDNLSLRQQNQIVSEIHRHTRAEIARKGL